VEGDWRVTVVYQFRMMRKLLHEKELELRG
jgi:hypothetical protein